MMEERGQFTALLDFLDRLQEARVSYDVEYGGNRAILVTVHLPMECWEFQFHESIGVDVEIFKSSGVEEATERMKELFERMSD